MKLKPIILAGAVVLVVVLGMVWTYRKQSASPGPTSVVAPAPSSAPKAPGAPLENPQPKAVVPSAAAGTVASSAVPSVLNTGGQPILARLKAAQSLGRDLSAAEIQSLYGYLRTHEIETNQPMRGVIKNQVILALKAQRRPPPDLIPVLLGIFNDREQDVVIRDYALQHLVTWYERAGGERALVQQTLWTALRETDSSIGGTALLALHRLAGNDRQIDRAKIEQAALEMTRHEDTGELARITAIQVCAERKLESALPVLLQMIDADGSPIPLRMSAVAAVGAMGGTRDIALLERLRSEGNPAIQTAVEAALKKLKKRLQG